MTAIRLDDRVLQRHLNEVETPSILVDLEVVERNLEHMATGLAERGVSLRPHAKTHKSVALARMQIEKGAAGITVGTLGEAEVMAAGGIEDIFVAYPLWPVGDKADLLRRLHTRVPNLSVGVDSVVAAEKLAAVANEAEHPLAVVVEVDSGERRTGLMGADQAEVVALTASEFGLAVKGVYTHGGHSYRPGESGHAAADEVRVLLAAAQALRSAGFLAETVSAGSTPTALLSAVDGITEERPGTYIFGDRQQVALGAMVADQVALCVAATVVSTSIPNQFVIDAGAKVLAKDLPEFLEGYGEVVGYPWAVIERTYDYHGVVRVPPGAERPSVGSVVGIIPNHVCPVVNLADRFLAYRGDSVEIFEVDARGRNS